MKKTISILLTFLMLASSTGATMATHFCCGKAVKSKLMLGQHDLDCGMRQMDEKYSSDMVGSMYQFKTKKCCDNDYTSIDSDDTIPTQSSQQSIDASFLIVFTCIYLGIDPFKIENNSPFVSYLPPILEEDIPVLYQSFLI